jgi:hypothetical protein
MTGIASGGVKAESTIVAPRGGRGGQHTVRWR